MSDTNRRSLGVFTAAVLCVTMQSHAVDVPLYGVFELAFSGPSCTPSSKPAADIEFYTEWEHESGLPRYKVHGFWDGDGQGGTSGSVFKIRFCPTKTGEWRLVNTFSNRTELDNEREGTTLNCIASANHGFWQTEGIWFRRSDGSRPYMVGNVHYCLVSAPTRMEDIEANADYFNKLRFMVQGFDLCGASAPFFSSSGTASTAGSDASRPNPSYFRRIDEMVQAGFARDLAIDMYTDPQNNAPKAPGYLRYLAARFGSYPNVWFQLGIEWSEYMTATETKQLAAEFRSYLPYPTPLTTIGTQNWSSSLNAPCWSHVNIQGKVFGLTESANAIIANRATGGGIVTNNDDNGPNFEGYGGTTGPMEVERSLGCFLGGGYTGTGYKTGYKQGPYMFGGFDPDQHTCVRRLAYMRTIIDRYVRFWKMAPKVGRFANASGCAWMGWADSQYVIGSDASHSNVVCTLGTGTWEVRQFDLMAMDSTVLTRNATGVYSFSTPSSVAVMTVLVRRDIVQANPVNTFVCARRAAGTTRSLSTTLTRAPGTGYRSVTSVHDLRGRLLARDNAGVNAMRQAGIVIIKQ